MERGHKEGQSACTFVSPPMDGGSTMMKQLEMGLPLPTKAIMVGEELLLFLHKSMYK